MDRTNAGSSGTSCPLSENGRGTNVGDLERVGSILAGGGLALAGLRHIDSIGGAALALIGGGLVYRGVSGHCSLYQALGVNTRRSSHAGVPARHGTRVDQAVFIHAGPEQIFDFLQNLENLPRFMNHVEAVRCGEGTRSHWTARGPLGITAEWDVEIINAKPNQLIAWRSLPGSQVDTAGSVRLTPDPSGRGTEVRVELKYDPPLGKAGIALVHLLGDAPEQQLAADLFRLKRVVEAGELTPSGSQGSGNTQVLNRAAGQASLRARQDNVDCASADSFPASDPPGWTATAATPKAEHHEAV